MPSRLAADLVRALLPGRCPGCGGRGEPVCGPCRGRLSAPEPVPPPPGVERWAAPFAYEGVGRELVARVKYRDARAAVPWLADAMAVAAARWGPVPVDVATWAPTTPSRRRNRGFDPAELLARAVARRLAVPCARLLDRREGPPQTGRDAAARRRGPEMHSTRPLRNRSILVVDDVATTGGTLAAAARALRRDGATRVAALTAARTPRRAGAPGRPAYTRPR